MKKLKLFPKIFIYTLALLLLITMLASGTIYLLAPMMGENSVLSEGTYVDGMSSAIRTAAIPRNTEIAHTILRSLPYTIAICIVVSLLCAYFFSKAITNPIKGILDATNHMAVLDRKAACKTATNDEIGILANQINQLYQNLLSTIEHLQEEKDKVSEAEKQKIDFLRSASHELKTPVTALNAMLENMILKVGKYSDYEEYLPLCKERTEQLSKMISEVLDASKLGTTAAEEPQALAVDCYLSELCKQYRLIAQANGISFQEAFPETFTITLPPKTFARAFSNILSNAVAYTLPGHSIFVRIDGRKLIVENECEPISAEHLKHIFEPFYRPDYARNQNDGGNGLGLYIVASILDSLKLSYSLEPIQNHWECGLPLLFDDLDAIPMLCENKIYFHIGFIYAPYTDGRLSLHRRVCVIITMEVIL